MSDAAENETGNRVDRAPGEEVSDEKPVRGSRGYFVGYFLALLLTAASFGLVTFELVWPPTVPDALVALALAQIGVHLVFFLHMTSGPDNSNNAAALAFGVFVTIVLIVGSVWIMHHLDHRMMPMTEMMKRMR